MYRVRTVFSGMQGAPWLSTMHFDELEGTAQQAVAAVGAFWGAVDALMDSEVDWTTEADVALIDAATGQLTAVTNTTPVTGTGASVGDALPLATQALVRWRTGFIIAGRELRGRTFIPALTEAQNDNGNVITAARTAINTAADALIADINSGLTIYSRTHFNDVTALTGSTSTQFAVLRSRRD